MHDFGGPGAVELGLVSLVAGKLKGPQDLGPDSGPYEVPSGGRSGNKVAAENRTFAPWPKRTWRRSEKEGCRT